MRRRRLWTAATFLLAVLALTLPALTLPAGAGSRSSAETANAATDTAIFYYPWYSTPARDGQWAHWYVHGSDGQQILSTPYYPVRGLYSSSNAKLVDAQMAEIAAAGISTVVVSWWGAGSPEDQRLPLVAAAAARHGVSVAVHIEPYRGRTPTSAAQDIQALQAQGYTVFYVYDIDEDPAADWAAALAPLEGVEVFGQTNLVGRAKAGGFDGLYTYDVVTWNGSTFARTCSQAHKVGLLCAPSVGPGYDARLATSDEAVRLRLRGATYDRMWRYAVRARADIVTVTSYNEWQEGTQIEPARAQVKRWSYEGAWGRHGVAAQRAYLQATARWTARFRSSHVQ
jgi:hypothetical protein